MLVRYVDIVSERLGLREISRADAPALLAIYGDSAATRHMPFEPRTGEQVDAIIEAALKAAADEPRHVYAMAVTDTAAGEVIGVARLGIERDHPHSAEIGFGLRPDQWGRGLGTELVRLLLRLGFGELGLHRIWGARAPENTNAQLVMLTAGMVEEGRIRHHVPVRDTWRDSIVHSIIENEWSPHRSAGGPAPSSATPRSQPGAMRTTAGPG